MKRFLNILFTTILLLGAIAVLVVITLKQRELQVKDIVIKLHYSGKDIYLTENYIKNIIYQTDDSIQFRKIKEIDIPKIENNIRKNSYVDYVNVYSGIEGNLVIDINQRQPLFRVENSKQSYYVGTKGHLIPLHWKYASRVMIVNGHIRNINLRETKDILSDTTNPLYAVYKVAKYISNDEFLCAQIEQIYVNKKQEIELIPKVGRQVILFGKAENINKKFENLMLFYEQGIPQSGWNKYKTINLKYKDQIVCTKK